MDTIYVRLLNEGVDCRRPVLAVRVAPAKYRIVDQPYDSEAETWEFTPGAVVEVIERTFQDGTHALAAME